MNLMILSAGLGTRLKPITDKIPKPAVPLLNVPMFFYSYHYFNSIRLENAVVNTFHHGSYLKEKLGSLQNGLTFISDGKEVLGTGGGISNARHLLEGKGSFWVANGDSVFLSDEEFIAKTQKQHLLNNPIATLVVTEHPEVGSKFGGIWVDDKGKVLDFGKSRPDKAVHGYHFTGFRVLSDTIFPYLTTEPSELFDAFRLALKDGHEIQVFKTDGEFFETGNTKDYLHCTKTLLDRLSEKRSRYLASVLKEYAPNTRLNDLATDLKIHTDFTPKYLMCDENFKIFDDVKLEGFIVAGKNVSVKEKSELKNTVILEGQTVVSNSSLKDEIIY